MVRGWNYTAALIFSARRLPSGPPLQTKALQKLPEVRWYFEERVVPSLVCPSLADDWNGMVWAYSHAEVFSAPIRHTPERFYPGSAFFHHDFAFGFHIMTVLPEYLSC